MMKAWVLHEIGDIRYEEIEIPLPAVGEVRVRVDAAGICGSDIPRIDQNGAHRMPLVPGHEFSGVVEGIGKAVPSDWLGKRVGVYPLIPCGKCRPCRMGHPEMCRDYDYTGSRRDGAFAEYVTAPASNLIELPESVSFAEAAMLEPMAVAVHAMRMVLGEGAAPIKHDAKVVVCGLGTIGLLLTMFLKESGFQEVYVIGNKDSQRTRAEALGVATEYFCDSSKEDAAAWIRQTTGGADVYFECVGRQECVNYGIDASAPGGRIVLVGNPASDMALTRECYWKILRNQLIVRGSWNSTFYGRASSEDAPDDWRYVLSRLSEHKITPAALITHRLPLTALATGLGVMRDKTEDYCKVMVVRAGMGTLDDAQNRVLS